MAEAKPGDRLRIRAADWNRLVKGIDPERGGDGFGTLAAEQQVEILVRNDTVTDLVQFSILEITGVLIDYAADAPTFKTQRAVTGEGPTGDTTAPYCVTLEPIAIGKIGRATILGCTPVKVSLSNTAHRYAQPFDYQSLTSSADYGSARILWIEDNFGSVGLKWAFVLLLGEDTAILDTSATVKGQINLSNQALGRGTKVVERLGIGADYATGTTIAYVGYNSAEVIGGGYSNSPAVLIQNLPASWASTSEAVNAWVVGKNLKLDDGTNRTWIENGNDGTQYLRLRLSGTSPANTVVLQLRQSGVVSAAEFSAPSGRFDDVFGGQYWVNGNVGVAGTYAQVGVENGIVTSGTAILPTSAGGTGVNSSSLSADKLLTFDGTSAFESASGVGINGSGEMILYYPGGKTLEFGFSDL